MAVWVGGDKEAYTKVRTVLDASYSSVMYTGGLGTAMIPKVNITHRITLSEALSTETSCNRVLLVKGLSNNYLPQVLSNMLCGLQVCAMAEAMLIGVY